MTPRDDVAGARYRAMFTCLAARVEGAFVPFVVLGDPDPASSLDIVLTLARSGADALELGIPFSDPVADGPAIQAAVLRALRAGTRIENAWAIVARVRQEFPALPIGLLVYANGVVHAGTDGFYARAAAAGVDSVLVTDAPLLEAARFEEAAASHGICPVLIAPPNAEDARLAAIAARSRGYVYVTSRRGVTGVDRELPSDAVSVLARLRTLSSAPPLVGFGISTPEHVRRALALGAAGAISGSAVAAVIERCAADRSAMIAEAAGFVREMKAATRLEDRSLAGPRREFAARVAEPAARPAVPASPRGSEMGHKLSALDAGAPSPKSSVLGKSVRLYFDLVSPYSWLALSRVEAFGERHAIAWDARPVVYAALLDTHELVGPVEVESKRRYTFHDVARCAAELGLTLTGPPAHPFRSLEALRAVCLFHDDPRRLRLAVALADACWSAGRALTEPSVLAEVVAAAGLDASDLARRTADPAVKERLRRNTEQALQAGVFGVPTFVYEGELFWGHDRMEHLARRIGGPDPEARRRAEEMLARPRGADRRRR